MTLIGMLIVDYVVMCNQCRDDMSDQSKSKRVLDQETLDFLKQSDELISEEKYDEAIELCNNFLNRNKYSSDAYFQLGIIYSRKNDINNAIQYFAIATESDRGNTAAKTNLQILLKIANQYVETSIDGKLQGALYFSQKDSLILAEDFSLKCKLIGLPVYQKKVLEAWSFIELDQPLLARKKVIEKNIETSASFWNIHVGLSYTVNKIKPSTYLEVGVRTGGSLVQALHKSSIKSATLVDIWSGEYAGFDNTIEYTKNQLANFQSSSKNEANLDFIKGDSHKILKDFISQERKFDLINIDGDHSEAGAWEDILDGIELLDEKGVLIFDDIVHPLHLYLFTFIKKLLVKFPYLRAVYNSEHDNGCVIFLKNISFDEFLPDSDLNKSDNINNQNRKNVKIAGKDESDHDLTEVSSQSSFSKIIEQTIFENKPKKILETGTYLGNGTTKVIAKSLNKIGSHDTVFYSIEVNPQNYYSALQNLSQEGLLGNVNLLNGLSVPRIILPSKEEIKNSTVEDIEYDNIFIDHEAANRVDLYFDETNYPDAEDDLIGKCLIEFDYKPDFVLLDSGGHMGNLEFNYLLNKLRSECIIALDDIYHIKHHKSFIQIQNDPRFEILYSSEEKFGFCFASFTPFNLSKKKKLEFQINQRLIVNCPLCGKDNYTHVRTGNIVKCNNCDMVYLRERPSVEWLENYYAEKYVTPDAAPTVKTPQSKSEILTKDEYKGANRDQLLKDAINIWGKEIKDSLLVDIGCGWGGLLNNAKEKGFNVLGFELTKKNAEFANNELQIQVHSKQFEEVPLEKNSIDIVTMSHVLEHVPQPSNVVNKIYNELNDGGIFYCVVPNFDSFCSKVLQEEWLWLERDWHYSHFTVETITDLFKKTGFEIVKIETKAGDYGEKIPKDLLKRRFPDKSEKSIAEIYSEKELNNLGEEIRIVGRKTFKDLSPSKSENKNLIWIRTDSIGDQILSASMLQPINEYYKDYAVTVVCQQHIAQIYAKCPYVKNVISFNRSTILYDNNYLNKIINEIRLVKAEITINSIYSRDIVSDKLALESGSKVIIGYEGDKSNLPENLWQLHNKKYTTLIKSDHNLSSEIERNNHFVKELGISDFQISPNIWLDESDEKFAEEFFTQNNLNENNAIVLFAGAQHAVRLYYDYGKAINEALKGKDFKVVLLGSTGDREINEINAQSIDLPVIDITGKTSITQSAAIIKKSPAVIGAETGMAHIACAVGTPNIILLGGGHFGRFMPYSNLTSIVALPLDCYGCNWQCSQYEAICVKQAAYENLALALNERLDGTVSKLKFYIQNDYLGKWIKNSPEIVSVDEMNDQADVSLFNNEVIAQSESLIKESLNKLKLPQEFNNLTNYLGKLLKLYLSDETSITKIQNLEEKLIHFPQKQIETLKKELLESEDNAYANYVLYLILKNENQTMNGLFHLKKSLKQFKTRIALDNIIELLIQEKRFDEAIVYFKELLEMGITDKPILLKAKKIIDFKKISEVNKLSAIDNIQDFSRSYHITQTDSSDDEKIIVSIVIPTKKRNDGLIAFINNLHLALYKINFEIILLASDRSSEELSNFIKEAKIKKVYYDDEIFGENEKFSWTKLMNFGFSKAEGEWVMYASDDIVIHPLAFNYALQIADDPKVGGVTFLHRNTVVDYGGHFKNYGFDTVLGIPFINFGIVRKSAFDKVSGFDERFKFYNGDLDLCWRIVKKGFSIFPSYLSFVEHNNIDDQVKSQNSGKVFSDDQVNFKIKWLEFIKGNDFSLSKERKILTNPANHLRFVFQNGTELGFEKENFNNTASDYQFNEEQSDFNESNSSVKVSAIVSVYNSEKYIEGCLKDLVGQSLYKKGDLEIVIVNSGSEQNEEKFILDFKNQFDRIVYIKTENRETVYQAWNRAIKAANGKYITNANTDDRHHPEALETLARNLDEQNSIDLVYHDSIRTFSPNVSIENAEISGYFLWTDYSLNKLFEICFIGPHPMWRKSLHSKYGYFDENFVSAGDYEFWLRIADENNILHVPEILGLYLDSDTSIEHRNQNISIIESEKAREMHWKGIALRPAPQGTFLVKASKNKLIDDNVFFSVIIPTLNRPEMLERALKSLEIQSFKNFEVIIVNDGGDDLTSVANKFNQSFNFTLLQHAFNQERSIARNNGIRVSQGEYVLFLDDDDLFYENHLQIIKDSIEEKFRVYYTDASRAKYKNENGNLTLIKKFVPYSMDFSRNRLLIGNIAPINCFAIERETLMKSGLFDPEFQVLEDWELLLRVSQFTSFKHIKEITCEVTWGDDGSTTTSSRQLEFHKARNIIYSKYNNEITKIPDKEKLIEEFETIWDADFLVNIKNLSIIIPTFNKWEFTQQCLNSTSQHSDVVKEVIVVDNASDDVTLEEIKNYDVTLISNKENKGFPIAVNQGIVKSEGKYVLISNNDVIIPPGSIERMIKAAESDPQIGIVGPISNSVSGGQKDNSANYKTLPEMYTHAEKIAEVNNGKIIPFPRIVFLCTLIKREVIDKIGGLDEIFSPGNFEDDDFCLRAQMAGYKNVIAADAFVHHYGSVSFGASGAEAYEKRIKINKEKFTKKWGGTPEEIWLEGKQPKNGLIAFPIDKNEFIQFFQRANLYIQSDELTLAKENLEKCLSLIQQNKVSPELADHKEKIVDLIARLP